MSIDRQRFLWIALSMGVGQQAGCTVYEPAPQPTYVQSTQGGDTTVTTVQGPAPGCASWDAYGNCLQWGDPQAVGGEPDCVQWDPTGECVGWAYTAPAGE